MASSLAATTAPFRPTSTATAVPTPINNDCGVLADAFPALQLPSSSDNPRICCTGDLTPDVDLRKLENAIYCRGERIAVIASSGRPIGSSIPSSIARLEALEHLQVVSANLTGTIPASIGSMASLNQIGGIPKELGNLRNLTVLNLGFNKLSGPLPQELSNLRNLTTLSLVNNTFSGELFASLATLPKIELLDLRFNFLNGTAPIAFSRLQFSFISANCFTTVENKTGYADGFRYTRPAGECEKFYGISPLPATTQPITITALPTSAPDTSSSSQLPIAAIVGGVVGAFVVAAVVAFFVFRSRRNTATAKPIAV
ncbi:hypothetical protein HDU96_000454 [Phlyctochytrium bullatum]|nr:hypothetical protein HDU96_000454 [Phlyctochytrium bullatum]